jgi:hypothetical protein
MPDRKANASPQAMRFSVSSDSRSALPCTLSAASDPGDLLAKLLNVPVSSGPVLAQLVAPQLRRAILRADCPSEDPERGKAGLDAGQPFPTRCRQWKMEPGPCHGGFLADHPSPRSPLDDPVRLGAGWRTRDRGVIDPLARGKARGSTIRGEADALANRREWAFSEIVGGGGR